MRITHQTGEADFEQSASGLLDAGWGERADVGATLTTWWLSFADADLVICRAGATTTAELIAAGKAAIMIPFPLAADDHQRKNAEALRSGRGRQMILQQDLSGARLAQEIQELVQSPDEIRKMEEPVANWRAAMQRQRRWI